MSRQTNRRCDRDETFLAVSVESVRQYIGGQRVAASGGETFLTVNPADNQPITTVPSGDERDIDRAVAAAKEAFAKGPWRRMKVDERIAHSGADRRGDFGERRGAGPAGNPGYRSAHQADPGSNPPGGAKLPLLRRFGPSPADRERLPGGRDFSQLHGPPARRRRRSDHPLEHPLHAFHLETGPLFGGGEHLSC